MPSKLGVAGRGRVQIPELNDVAWLRAQRRPSQSRCSPSNLAVAVRRCTRRIAGSGSSAGARAQGLPPCSRTAPWPPTGVTFVSASSPAGCVAQRRTTTSGFDGNGSDRLAPTATVGVDGRTFVRYRVVMGPEERFTQLRLSAACAHLSREQVAELVALTANLIEERKRIRRVLERLPEHFTEVRDLLNELSRAVR